MVPGAVAPRRCALLAAARAFGAALAMAGVAHDGALAQARRPDLDVAARRIGAGIDALRAAQRAAPLERDAQLARAAADFAAYMAARDRYGHEADGRTPVERAQAAGYRHCAIAENIAMQYSSAGFDTAGLADRLVRGWEASPPHRRNLLDTTLTQTGIALARSEATGRYYAVQLFGRPETLQLRFSIVNRTTLTLRYTLDGEPATLQPRATVTHTTCDEGRLAFAPEGEGAAPAIPAMQASAGARYVITRRGDGWSIEDTPR